MSQIQEWNYRGDADINYGDVHVSPVPKIALILTIISIIAASVAGVVFRQTLGDIFINPQLVLIGEEVDVDIYSDFDPKEYITATNYGQYELVSIDENVDTDKLGDYTVVYKSKNTVNELSQEMTVHVVDRAEPVILLKTDDENLPITIKDGQYVTEVLIGSDIANTFNPEDYIDIILDNYSDPDKLTYEYSSKWNFSKKGSVSIVYYVTDEHGNNGNTTLNIEVVEQLNAEKEAYEAMMTQVENELGEYLSTKH